MSQTEQEKPYMTEEIDGAEQTMILFIPHTGQFYEPLPEGHPDVDPDTALTMKDPRTGDTFDYQSGLGRYVQEMVGNHIRGYMTVEKWDDFRETYVDADEKDVDRAREQIQDAILPDE